VSGTIPSVFDQTGAAFVLLPAGAKFPPLSKGWQLPENAHGFQEAAAHEERGGNIGVLAGNGHGGLDQDDPSSFTGLELPPTTRWETRPGRMACWLRWSDDPAEVLKAMGRPPDQAQLKLFKDGQAIGEIKLQRSYQVVPPSWKLLEDGTRADYKLITETPPAEVSLDWLLSELQRLGVTFSSTESPRTRLEGNVEKLEGMKDASRREQRDTATKADQFLQEAVLMVAGKEGSRNERGLWLACQLRDLGISVEQAAEYMDRYVAALEAVRKAGQEPYTRGEALHGLEMAYSREPREPPKGGWGRGAPEQEQGQCAEELADPSPCMLSELLGVFKKWLHIEEDYNIVAPACAVIANFAPSEPDIIGLIQPSGSIKTELIRSLGQSENQFVYPLSSLTEHTLVSGHKDSKDLVPLLKGRLVCIKDFTTLLSKKEEVRAQIFADFRELTDGYIRKEFGNGIKKEYQGIHSSILFASTNAIERYYSMYAALGQRLIFIRPTNDAKAARERSFLNRGRLGEMRVELHQVMMRFLTTHITKVEETGLPSTPETIQEEMGAFYDFLAIARTQIHHNYRTGEIDELPEPEYPTRIANTIGRLVEVHAFVYGRGEVNEEDMMFGRRVVLDNIPTVRWRILCALTPEWETISVIAKRADLSTGAIRYSLDELISLRLVDRLAREEKDGSMDRRSDSFRLVERWVPVVEKLETSIIREGVIDNKLYQIIDKQNTVSSNSCLQLSPVDGGLEAEKCAAFSPRAITRSTGAAGEYAELSLNLFGGCSHKCRYCYNKTRFDGPHDVLFKKSTLGNIEYDLKALATCGDNRPVHLTFIGDAYDREREDNSYVRRVLELFKKYDRPIQMLTKGGMLAVKDFDLYGPTDRFGVSLTFLDPEKSKVFEPGAAPPGERIASLRVAKEKGIETWASCEPLLDPAEALAVIEAAAPHVDFYWLGKLNTRGKQGIPQDIRALEGSIDYVDYLVKAEALLQRLGKQYKIKKALLEAVEEQAARKSKLVCCAVCGADLAGKGQLSRDGKVYCLQPGCGYPAREKEGVSA
jgi:DNA repair photolyase